MVAGHGEGEVIVRGGLGNVAPSNLEQTLAHKGDGTQNKDPSRPDHVRRVGRVTNERTLLSNGRRSYWA